MNKRSIRFSGRKVVEQRNAAAITQNELARRASVHASQLSRWERGEQVPSADAVGVLAGALDCDVSVLFVDGEVSSDDDEEEDSLFEAAHELDRAGNYALADRLRKRAREAARATSAREVRL